MEIWAGTHESATNCSSASTHNTYDLYNKTNLDEYNGAILLLESEAFQYVRVIGGRLSIQKINITICAPKQSKALPTNFLTTDHCLMINI
mgnify:CR=1 FL=1